jgi:uncharacterized membrane protein YqjE
MGAESPGRPAAGGFGPALRALAGTLHDAVLVRGALLRVELREEFERRKRMLLLAALAFALLHMAFLLLSVLVVAAYWDTHRIAAVGTLLALHLVVGLAVFARLRSLVAASPAPLAATLGELGRDLAQLRATP